MNRSLIAPLMVAGLFSGCGGGGGGSDDGGSGRVSFSLADAPVDSADAVVVTVDKVILRRDGATDVAVERFTLPPLNLTNADTFQIDLLDYRDGARLLVIDQLEIPAGSYSQLVLRVLDDNLNYSYVDNNGVRTPIKLPSSELKLGGFTVNDGGVHAFTLDFDLRRAMTYNPGPDRYILKPRGVRMVDHAQAATLSGAVDTLLFNTDLQCSGKVNPTLGNVVYLYRGHGLDPARLADAFDPDSASNEPADAIEPYAAANVREVALGDWRYHFGYLPAGQYTLAFSCNAEGDFAETFDNTAIPLPTTQLVQVTLGAGQNSVCNLPVSAGACAP